MSDYVCALSGVEADDTELVEGSDDLGDLPVGWTKITVQRRLLNPRWYEVQQAKGALVEVTLSQLPEEMREQMRPLITVQVDAQFAALEAGNAIGRHRDEQERQHQRGERNGRQAQPAEQRIRAIAAREAGLHHRAAAGLHGLEIRLRGGFGGAHGGLTHRLRGSA